MILDDFHVLEDYKETDGRRIFPAEGDAGPIDRLVFESKSARSVGQLVFRKPRAESSCVVRGQLFVAARPVAWNASWTGSFTRVRVRISKSI